MITEINKQSSIPRYLQLEEIIKDRILLEESQPGDLFPSVRQLIKEYSVSLNCVRQALLNLQNEGIISLEPGKKTTLVTLPKKVKTRSLIFLLCKEEFLDPYCSRVLKGAEEEISEKKHYHLSYCQVDGHHVEEFFSEKMPLFKENRTDGIILLGETDNEFLTKLKPLGIPVVLIGDTGQEEVPSPEESVSSKEPNFFGSFQAISHLADLGHREIGFIRVSEPYFWWKQRYNGYKFALEQNNLSLNEEWIVNCPTEKNPEEGYKAMDKIFSCNSLPTALFISDIRLAMGVVNRIKEANLNIPEDFSIISFGNLGFSGLTAPPLTTVEHKAEEFGRKAVQAVFSQMRGEKAEFSKVLIAPTLAVRSSTAKPKTKEKRGGEKGEMQSFIYETRKQLSD